MTKELKKAKAVGEPTIEKDRLDKYRVRRGDLVSDQTSARGEIGSLDKSLCEDNGLHKKGLSMFNAMDKMSAEKRADALRTFDHLRDLAAAEWEAQGDLELGGTAETTQTMQ